MSAETVFLSLLFAGLTALIAGLGMTRLHWRQDIPPYGRGTRAVHVILHPGQYVKNAPLRAIRSLNTAGLLLLAGAAGTLAVDLVRELRR